MNKQNNARAYDQVKSHYNRAAENRNIRLQSPRLNAAKVNHLERLKIIRTALAGIGAAKKCLDIGTGTGVWSEVMLDYCDHVTGVDFAELNIKIARERAADMNLTNRLTYLEGDAELLSGINDNSFDIATHISVLQHLPDQRKALRRVNDILRKDGHLIILVHNRRCIHNRNKRIQHKRGAIIAVNHYNTVGEIVNALQLTGFQIEQIRLCWFFVFDFLMIGIENPLLRLFEPLRKALLLITSEIAGWMARCQSTSSLFREIIIVAKKKTRIE